MSFKIEYVGEGCTVYKSQSSVMSSNSSLDSGIPFGATIIFSDGYYQVCMGVSLRCEKSDTKPYIEMNYGSFYQLPKSAQIGTDKDPTGRIYKLTIKGKDSSKIYSITNISFGGLISGVYNKTTVGKKSYSSQSNTSIYQDTEEYEVSLICTKTGSGTVVSDTIFTISGGYGNPYHTTNYSMPSNSSSLNMYVASSPIAKFINNKNNTYSTAQSNGRARDTDTYNEVYPTNTDGPVKVYTVYDSDEGGQCYTYFFKFKVGSTQLGYISQYMDVLIQGETTGRRSDNYAQGWGPYLQKLQYGDNFYLWVGYGVNTSNPDFYYNLYLFPQSFKTAADTWLANQTSLPAYRKNYNEYICQICEGNISGVTLNSSKIGSTSKAWVQFSSGGSGYETIRIIYDLRGGQETDSCDFSEQSFNVNTQSTRPTVNLYSDSPIKEGYEFLKWNTEKDGSGINYNAGASYRLEEDLKLYAQWKQTIRKIWLYNGSSWKQGIPWIYTGSEWKRGKSAWIYNGTAWKEEK